MGTEGADMTNEPPPAVPKVEKAGISSARQTGSAGLHAAGEDVTTAPAAAGPPKAKSEKERG